VNGARIAPPLSSPQESRPIELPHQSKPIKHFAMDIGGSLIKLVYFESSSSEVSGETRGIGGKINFTKFQTRNIDECLQFILENHLHTETGGSSNKEVNVTGGGAHKFAQLIEEKLGITLHKEDEMHSLISGLNFLLKNVPHESFHHSTLPHDPNPKTFVPVGNNPYPFLLVNIGSGVSILKVDNETSYERIDGTSLGGGTFYGLCNLLTGISDFDEILELSTHGDSNKVDLLVGDIYGSSYSKVGLAADVIASSFGKIMYKDKLNLSFSNADIAMALLKMMCNNIGQIAYLDAVRYGLTRIYFSGFFIRDNPATMQRISYAVDFWSKGKIQAMFLLHEGYLGALGAFLQRHRGEAIETSEGMYEKSKQWLQKIISYAALSFDFSVKETSDSSTMDDPLCECGREFCEGIVCKQQNDGKSRPKKVNKT